MIETSSVATPPLRCCRRLHVQLTTVLLVLALPMAATVAQTRTPVPVTTIDSVRADGTVKAVRLPVHSGFDLFAASDRAVGGLRMSGALRSGVVNEGGPGASNQNRHGVETLRAFDQFILFSLGFGVAAGPSAYQRIRAAFPGISTMKGSVGYTAHVWRIVTTPEIRRIGPADGQLGRTFAGTLSRLDGPSCVSDPSIIQAGLQLLPMRDCPESWGSEGFLGKLAVSDSLWLARFNADKAGFRFDDWHIPRSQLNPLLFPGISSVYGYMSDYYSDQLQRYGSAARSGAGVPQDDGYPLGLEIRFDSWHAGGPLNDVMFYQAQIVNRSADVYGAGADYDSLYFGLTPSFISNSASMYVDVSTNTVFGTQGDLSGKCSLTYPRRYVGSTAGCPGNQAWGLFSMTWLKSPLGDLRNKLFSDAQSPFYNPGSKFADDTITFNHIRPNTFGSLSQTTSRSMRASFGMMSSTEENFLDGRTQSDFTLGEYLFLVVPEDFNGTIPPPGQFKYNRFIPGAQVNPATGQSFGKWDYNNDGIQDTIKVPMCGRQGCAAVFSDTSAGGYRNTFGNTENLITAGPFALKAGDTTQFLWAFSYAKDTASIRRNVQAAIRAYVTNDLPTSYVFPALATGTGFSVDAAQAVTASGIGPDSAKAASRISVRFPRFNAEDGFALRLAARVRADSLSGDATVRRLLRLNTGLLAKLEARARDNLAAVLVFKSCDDAHSFTRSNGPDAVCAPAPATDTLKYGALGWLSRARIGYAGGIPATTAFNDLVLPGRAYLYSFVARSRGYSDIRVVDSSAAGFFVTDPQTAFGFPGDSLDSPLLTTGPSVVRVYAPVSLVAGSVKARIDTATLAGTSTQPLDVSLAGEPSAVVTRVFYANQFIVRKTVDTVSNAVSTSVAARWILPRAATSATSAAVTNFVAMERVFSLNALVPVQTPSNVLAGTLRGTTGSARLYVDTITTQVSSSYVWVNADNQPIYALASHLPVIVAYQALSPLFPGFTWTSVLMNPVSGLAREITRDGTLRERHFLVRAPGDSAPANVRAGVPTLRPDIGVASTKRFKGGRYTLTWLTDPWGPGAPFSLLSRSSVQSALDASLRDVASKATTISDVSAKATTLTGVTASRPLVRVRVPFTLSFTDTDGRTEVVRLAMQKRVSNTRLLGTGNDTLRVTIPDSLWMPGDTLIPLQLVERDSAVGVGANRTVIVQPETVLGATGYRPIPVLADSIGIGSILNGVVFRGLVFGCDVDTVTTPLRPAGDRVSCNPLTRSSPGAGSIAHVTVQPGWKEVIEYARPLDERSVVQLTAVPASIASAIVSRDAGSISVVPNPYVLRSEYDVSTASQGGGRLLFTGVPLSGLLRIYDISGRVLRTIHWNQQDLVNAGSNVPSGDLPFDLRLQNGRTLGSGLYLFVVSSDTGGSNRVLHRGKFVVIQ